MPLARDSHTCRACSHLIHYVTSIGWVHTSTLSRWCAPDVVGTDTSEAAP